MSVHIGSSFLFSKNNIDFVAHHWVCSLCPWRKWQTFWADKCFPNYQSMLFIITFWVSSLKCMFINWKLSVIEYFFLSLFCFVFNGNAYGGFFNSFFNSSSCVSAFLLLCGLGALFLHSASSCACSFVFLHGVDSKAYLVTAMRCCSFVRLWLWSWGPVVAYTSHSFPLFFHAIYISLFLLSYCPLALWVLISIVPWFCISAVVQFTVLLSLVLCGPVSVGLWLESRGLIITITHRE